MYSVQITSEVGNSNYNRCGMGWGLSTMNYDGYPHMLGTDTLETTFPVLAS